MTLDTCLDYNGKAIQRGFYLNKQDNKIVYFFTPNEANFVSWRVFVSGEGEDIFRSNKTKDCLRMSVHQIMDRLVSGGKLKPKKTNENIN